ncbi:hypothetical protein ABLE53_22855 [Nocardioides sp. KR10-350]
MLRELASGLERFGEDRALGFGHGRLIGVIRDGVDVDAGEPGLVEPAAVGIAELLVGRRRLGDEVEDGVEGGPGIDPGTLEGVEFGFQGGKLAGELLLLLAGDVGWYDTVHGVLGPLVPIAADLIDALLEAAAVLVSTLLERPQLLVEPFADLRGDFGAPWLLLGVPERSDGRFDPVDGDVGRPAVVGLGVVSGADEVLIDATSSTALAVDHAGVTVPAVEAAGEVVEVLAFAVARGPISGQTRLDGTEERIVDDRLVGAGVFDVAPGDVSGVVAVSEHAVNLAAEQRPFGLLLGGLDGQSAGFEELGYAGERHGGVACVGLEGPADVVGTLGVELDDACLPAVDDRADVEIADRCPRRGSTLADLLFHALDDLLGEVLAVELGHRTEDPVNQLALGRLVDVLGNGDESGAGLADGEVDGDVVVPVAREPVELVNDDVLDPVGADMAEHLLQLGAVGGLGGFASLDELLDDLGADRLSLAPDGGPLRWKRESFCQTAPVGLFLGAHPDVADRAGCEAFGLQGRHLILVSL